MGRNDRFSTIKGVFILFFVLSVLVGGAYAFSREEHVEIWCACLGIEQKEARKSDDFNEILNELSDAIDSIKDFNNDVVEEFGLKSGFAHRYYFHWGWSADEPSRRYSTNANYGFLFAKKLPSRNDRNKLFKKLYSEWDGRKKRVERKISRYMPFLSDAEQKALAVTLYDIHILSDYSTNASDEISPLAPLKDLSREITERGFDKLFGPKNQVSAAINEQPWPQRHSDSLEEREKAKQMLDIIIKNMPPLMALKYADGFAEKLGITIDESMICSLEIFEKDNLVISYK